MDSGFRAIGLVTSLFLLLSFPGAAQQPPTLQSDGDLEKLVAENARITIDLPELTYLSNDVGLKGDQEAGSLAFTHSKVVYYFVHWGPIEVDQITQQYARERIPKLWPGEGLKVLKTEPATVAGHPAFYAEVLPRREFYRAFFLIWNCPETGRQFIADMNYNVSLKTPRAELEAELETTRKTLACHPDAPTTRVAGHSVRYDNSRYGLSFEHPPHWFVFDNPYGVPHPAYAGLRDFSVGSVLAWLQDMEVSFRFEWSPTPSSTNTESGEAMGIQLDLYRLGVEAATQLAEVEEFVPEESETLKIGSLPVLKITGTAELRKPEKKPIDFIGQARMIVLVAADKKSERQLLVFVSVDYHRKSGLLFPPDRSILDRWAVEIAKGLKLMGAAD